jgi:hypothetical protein
VRVVRVERTFLMKVPFDSVQENRISLPTLIRLSITMLRSSLALRERTRRTGVKQKFFDASSAMNNEVGPAIFRDYLIPALAAGTIRAAPPPPKIVGNSLHDVQKAFDIQHAGVSATNT